MMQSVMLQARETAQNDDAAAFNWQRRLTLSSEEIAACNRLIGSRVRTLAAHQIVAAHPGDEDRLLIVRRGWLGRHRDLSVGRRQVLSYVVPGEIEFLVGHTDLAEDQHDGGGSVVTALTDATVAIVERAELAALRKRHPRVASALSIQLRVAQATQREWLINLGQRSGADRVAHLLCELYLRTAGDGAPAGTSVRFPLTQSQLGEATGLTPIHVNRILQQLRGTGLVQIQDRRLTLPDLPRLAREVGLKADYLRLAATPTEPRHYAPWTVASDFGGRSASPS